MKAKQVELVVGGFLAGALLGILIAYPIATKIANEKK